MTIPHLSIQVPEETLNIYKGKIPEALYEHTSYLKHPFPRSGYAAMVTHLDKGIGEVVRLIKELDLEEDTIFLFTSDDGPTYVRLGGSDSDFFESAGPFRGLKGDLYEGGIRVPMIIRWLNKIQPGSISDQVLAFWDVSPTLADISGAKVADNLDGFSFLPTLLKIGIQKEHEFLYWEFPGYGGQQAVRIGAWKAIRTGLKRENSDSSIQLYNLHKDQGEKNNVAKEHPDI